MFVDARRVPADTVVDTDICIIGAGAAGLAMAREFAGARVRVAVLESGGLEPDVDTQRLADGGNIGLPYFPLAAARLRYLGGTTNHWGGHCRPFDDIDFEARPWVPLSGWPLTRADLQRYYDRAAHVCRLASPEWSPAYWLRQDTFPALPLQSDRLVTRIAQLAPSADRRFGRNHHGMLERAPNITTYLHANVVELASDEAARTVTHAQVACLSGNGFRVKAGTFVLAAGGIENARLLLLSNRRQPAGLGNGHDQVGRYFMEHPRLVTAIIAPADPRLAVGLYGPHHVRGVMIKGYIALSEQVIRREQMSDVQIDLDPVYDESSIEALTSDSVDSLRTLIRATRSRTIPADFARHIGNLLADATRWQKHTVTMVPLPVPTPAVMRDVWDADPIERLSFIREIFGNVALAGYAKIIGRLPLHHIEVTTRIEQLPNPRSRVKLGATRDALGLPQADLDWQLTSVEKRSALRALEIFGAELGRAGVGRLQITLPEGDMWPEETRGGWHHIGTTRMSENPRVGVVDRNCRVHGLANLFVAGSSVFATAGGATPTFTLIALSLRLADHLKERLK